MWLTINWKIYASINGVIIIAVEASKITMEFSQLVN